MMTSASWCRAMGASFRAHLDALLQALDEEGCVPGSPPLRAMAQPAFACGVGGLSVLEEDGQILSGDGLARHPSTPCANARRPCTGGCSALIGQPMRCPVSGALHGIGQGGI